MENIKQKEAAVNDLKNMVAYLARSYDFRGSDFDDLYQVGMIELWKALEHYEPNKGASLSSFAHIWISGGMRKYVRENNTIKLSKDILAFNRVLNNQIEILTQQNMCVPTMEEVALSLGVDVEDVWKARLALEVSCVQSSDYEYGDDGKALNIYDCYGYEDSGLNDNFIDLKMAVDRLNDEEQKIINMKFYQDQSQQEIADALGINQVGVSRKLVKVLGKLRNDLVA